MTYDPELDVLSNNTHVASLAMHELFSVFGYTDKLPKRNDGETIVSEFLGVSSLVPLGDQG